MAKENKKGVRYLLSLDLSTTSTGFALFDLDNKRLMQYGVIKPKVPGISKLKYPRAAYARILDISQKVKVLVERYAPSRIVIEETNRGISRTSQKSLDALHFFVLHFIDSVDPNLLDRIYYYDSNGAKGWRTHLKLKLSDKDKAHNAHIKTFKKKDKSKAPKPITWKHLASRYVAEHYRVNLNVDEDSSNSDICDAIALGSSYLQHVLKRKS